MSRKLLIANLLIAAILISWVLPANVLGATMEFYPKNQDYGTGYMEKELLFSGGKYYRKRSGVIMVGYIHNTTSSDFWYRGFADFDISGLPADACVGNISLVGSIMGLSPSSGHSMEIRHLTKDPITQGFFNLYDAIGSGSKYTSCSACMTQAGTHTVLLPPSSRAHLEAAQAQGWFALGFTESREDDQPGLWFGWADPSPPILRVTYLVPPRVAPSPSISVDSICSGNEFCVTWYTVPGATTYQIMEAGGLWTGVGTNTSRCYTRNVTGVHTFYVRAGNECNFGPFGSTSVKVINVPATPNKPVASSGPYCINVSYRISWTPLAGADSYQIREDNGGWISVGNTTQRYFTHPSAGSHSYVVRGVNMCGVGYPSSTVSVTLQTIPSAPSAQVTADSVCTANQFCVTWQAVPGATSYEIREDQLAWQNVGSGTSKCFSKSVARVFSYRVRARNGCGVSSASQSATVQVVGVPATLTQPVVGGGPYCTNSDYTISWTPIVGVNSYEIREDNGGWISVGSTTQRNFNHSSAGSHSYVVRGVNMCGAGNPSVASSVNVETTPAAPATPSASNSTPCPEGKVTISWEAIQGATSYRLSDLVAVREVYVGPNLKWTGPHPSGSFEYSLAVATNGCGWSNNSRPVTVNVKRPLSAPRAPVSDQDTANVGEPYTISWERVAGAASYELYEGGATLVYRGPDLSSTMSKDLVGDFTYSVKACDECGCSGLGAELAMSVGQQTAVEDIDAPNLPDGYSLSQNYPNPFNPETQIEFSLKRGGHVELTVYNVLGEAIRSLVNGQLSAGYKAVTWNGHDNSGRQVTSGIYMYKLTTGEYTETRKMMLLK